MDQEKWCLRCPQTEAGNPPKYLCCPGRTHYPNERDCRGAANHIFPSTNSTGHQTNPGSQLCNHWPLVKKIWRKRTPPRVSSIEKKNPTYDKAWAVRSNPDGCVTMPSAQGKALGVGVNRKAVQGRTRITCREARQTFFHMTRERAEETSSTGSRSAQTRSEKVDERARASANAFSKLIFVGGGSTKALPTQDGHYRQELGPR
jgi:hypothetical protein